MRPRHFCQPHRSLSRRPPLHRTVSAVRWGALYKKTSILRCSDQGQRIRTRSAGAFNGSHASWSERTLIGRTWPGWLTTWERHDACGKPDLRHASHRGPLDPVSLANPQCQDGEWTGHGPVIEATHSRERNQAFNLAARARDQFKTRRNERPNIDYNFSAKESSGRQILLSHSDLQFPFAYQVLGDPQTLTRSEPTLFLSVPPPFLPRGSLENRYALYPRSGHSTPPSLTPFLCGTAASGQPVFFSSALRLQNSDAGAAVWTVSHRVSFRQAT